MKLISFFGMLAIVFITLKLTGTITWSWWLVLLPLYWPIPAIMFLLICILVTEFLAAYGKYIEDKGKL